MRSPVISPCCLNHCSVHVDSLPGDDSWSLRRLFFVIFALCGLVAFARESHRKVYLLKRGGALLPYYKEHAYWPSCWSRWRARNVGKTSVSRPRKTAVLQETGGRVVSGPLWLSDQEHFQSLCRKAEQEWCTCFLKGWTLTITYIDIHPYYISSLNPWNSPASVGTSWLLEALTAAMSTPKLDGDDGEARDEATKRHVAHPAFTIGIMWVIGIIWDNMDLSSK